jgi:Protein of unknown function (DUF3006)
MKVTIDRFEGDYAVCENPDRNMRNIRKEKLPAVLKKEISLSSKETVSG